MSDIETNLQNILDAVYGRDVRQSIHDAIHDCYEDGKTGATDLIARERISQIISSSNASLSGYAVETKQFGLANEQTIAQGGYAYTGSTSFSEDVTIIDVVAFNMVGQTGVPISYNLSNRVLTATATVPYTATSGIPVMAVYLVQRPIKINELADIRIGEDGTEYPTAGDAVREQISDLKSQINQLEAIPYAVKLAMDAMFANASFEDYDASSDYAVFHAWASAINVVSLSAVFNQTDDIYLNTALDDLRQYLTVTATYDNDTSGEVSAYTLSGELTAGTSTITATYNDKSTTFTVNVTNANDVTPALSSYVTESGEAIQIIGNSLRVYTTASSQYTGAWAFMEIKEGYTYSVSFDAIYTRGTGLCAFVNMKNNSPTTMDNTDFFTTSGHYEFTGIPSEHKNWTGNGTRLQFYNVWAKQAGDITFSNIKVLEYLGGE